MANRPRSLAVPARDCLVAFRARRGDSLLSFGLTGMGYPFCFERPKESAGSFAHKMSVEIEKLIHGFQYEIEMIDPTVSILECARNRGLDFNEEDPRLYAANQQKNPHDPEAQALALHFEVCSDSPNLVISAVASAGIAC